MLNDCVHGTIELLVADHFVVVLIDLVHDLLPKLLILLAFRASSLLENPLQLGNAYLTVAILVEHLECRREVLIIYEFYPVYCSSDELLVVYPAVSVDIEVLHQLLPVRCLGLEGAKDAAHPLSELLQREETILRGVTLNEHLLEIDQLALLDFDLGQQRKDPCLEDILLLESNQVGHDGLGILLAQAALVGLALEPRVLEELSRRGTLAWVLLEHHHGEVDGCFRQSRQVASELRHVLNDGLVNLRGGPAEERRGSTQKDVGYDTDAPYIDFFIVLLLLNYFRSHV